MKIGKQSVSYTCQLAYRPASLLLCLLACLNTRLHSCHYMLLVRLPLYPAYMLTCLLHCLPACQSVCLTIDKHEPNCSPVKMPVQQFFCSMSVVCIFVCLHTSLSLACYMFRGVLFICICLPAYLQVCLHVCLLIAVVCLHEQFSASTAHLSVAFKLICLPVCFSLSPSIICIKYCSTILFYPPLQTVER